jgi:hypothetical protein
LAEAAIATIAGSSDLPTEDVQVIFELYDDADFTERVVVSGTTTDATRNVVFRAASGEQHTGLLDTGVHFEPTAATGHIWTILDDFIGLQGLELQQYASSGGSDECVRVGDGSNAAVGLFIDKCIISTLNTGDTDGDGVYAGGYSVGSSGNPVTLRDCVLTDFGRAGIHAQSFTGTTNQYFDIVNCTINGGARGFGYTIFGSGSNLVVRMINAIITDTATADFAATGVVIGTLTTTGSSNNFDERGQVPGAGSPNPITATDSASPGAGDWCIFTSISGDDFRLQEDADNDVIDGGVGPASNSLVSTIDIIGATRSGTTCDPGAFEIADGGAPIAAGTAAESDSALALAPSKVAATGAATESDSAPALTISHTVATGVSAETDVAHGPLLHSLLATETDSAQALGLSREIASGIAAESDTALALAATKVAASGAAAETDTGVALSLSHVVSVGVAPETDSAQAPGLTSPAEFATGAALESDSAQALALEKPLSTGVSAESEAALSLALSRSVTTGAASETDVAVSRGLFSLLATEQDTALALSLARVVATGIASESDAAEAPELVSWWRVGVALESDTALALDLTSLGLSTRPRVSAWQKPTTATVSAWATGARPTVTTWSRTN